MMWPFIKNNRGKFALAVGIATGTCAYHVYQNYFADASFSRPTDVDVIDTGRHPVHQPAPFDDPLARQSRVHYLFDSNHRASNASILESFSSLRGKLKAILRVDEAVETLRQASPAQKLTLYNQLKVDALARLIAWIYGNSILMIAMKIQVNLLAADIRRSMEAKVPFVAQPDPDERVSAEQVFLSSIQYFLTNGIQSLVERVAEVVKNTVGEISLTSPLTRIAFSDQLNLICAYFESELEGSLSKFIVPIDIAELTAINVSKEQGLRLRMLFRNWQNWLDCAPCAALLRWTSGAWLKAFMEGVIKAKPELLTLNKQQNHRLTNSTGQSGAASGSSAVDAVEPSLPLIKFIPLVSDGFDWLSTGESCQQLAMTILDSDQLRLFAKSIFETQ